MKEIYVGAAYYPEMWDESEIDNDIRRCKEYGLNTLRIGEFSWGKMEPEEGKFAFGWLERIVDKLYENGINTVMCTPTCTPPRWLLNKYEETRRVLPELKRQDVSDRCHVCKTSPVAREKNAKIVTEMAKVFAGRKGIVGWQIDNEIFPYYEGCFCPLCKNAFRKFLKTEYGDIVNLNKKWGMVRWSLEYASFDDVEPPYPNQWRHPSLRNAWWKFQCAQIKSYVEEQADILHSFGIENVGTDMMQQNYLSYQSINENLDVVQFNHYNVAEDLSQTAFSYDFLRCLKDKPFWVTETQVGWNGSEFADSGYRPQGNCYANTWLPIAKGAEMNLYWLFRTHPNGHELAHGALFSSAGRAYKVSDEVKRASKEINACKKFLTETKIESKIALHYSATALNSFGSAPIVKGLDYRKILNDKFYAAFKHRNVDIIETAHSLDGYQVIISPFLAVADEYGFKERITEWIKKGGVWIVGPMSDIMDGSVTKFTHAPYGFLEELAGVYTVYQKPVDNDVFKAEWNDGTECGVGICFDAYEPLEGTRSLAKYSKGEFTGYSVITRREIGKGSVVLLGSVPSREDLNKLAGIAPIAKASDNVVLVARNGRQSGVVAIETENKEGFIVLDKTYVELLTGKELSGKIILNPYEVLVLKAL